MDFNITSLRLVRPAQIYTKAANIVHFVLEFFTRHENIKTCHEILCQVARAREAQAIATLGWRGRAGRFATPTKSTRTTVQTARTSSLKCRVYQVVNLIHKYTTSQTNNKLTYDIILKGFQLWQEKKQIRK